MFHSYLPGTLGEGGDPFLLKIRDFLFSSKFLGALFLLLIAYVVARVITKN